MKVKELYDHITKHMAPEEALMKLLEGSIVNYEKLKFNEGEAIHPVVLISMCAFDLGWQLVVEPNEPKVRGMTIGTSEYMDGIFKKENVG